MIDIRFDNLDAVRKIYDAGVVEKAAGSAIQKLGDRVATQVSRKVRERYPVPARMIADALNKQTRTAIGTNARMLIYTGKRLSLRKFSQVSRDGSESPKGSARPKVKTARGIRYGARVRDYKKKPSRIVKRGFWGRGRRGQNDAENVYQIFQRIDKNNPKSDLRKLTGPSIAHMIRSDEVLKIVQETVEARKDDLLRSELDHFFKKSIGAR